MSVAVSLTDKYEASHGLGLMTGMQALVRLVLEQADADRAAGIRSGGYVSGYRGSPVGGLDAEFLRAAEQLERRGVVFEPGLNEELAATAVGGTQTLSASDDPLGEGVFGMWYGKGPGVDRSLDAIKHAALTGTTAKGGLLFVFGDDPLSKSSTTAHQSEQAMISAMVPVLFPATIHEFVTLGLHGFAMSRYSGALISMKLVTDTADSSATLALDGLRPDIELPPPGPAQWPLHADGPLPRDEALFERLEARMFDRMEAVKRYARANRLNRPIVEPQRKRLGIVAVGKAWPDVMAGLKQLGLSGSDIEKQGIGVYQMRLVWPIEEQGLLEFVDGYEQILVVEEKRALVETELARLLVNSAARPVVVGKTASDGSPLVPKGGQLTPDIMARVLEAQAGDLVGARVAVQMAEPANAPPLAMGRMPYYCAGCPYNRGARLPDGSMAGGGIGCHSMSVLLDGGVTQHFTQMGGEGLHWIGRARFSRRRHMFQNLGDGTFVHSGLLAIRAAVNSGVNITYKIYCNDAVAMTGGQLPEGAPTPPEIARQVMAVGVRRVVVVSDDIRSARRLPGWPDGDVTFHDRAEHIAVQERLREQTGATALIYVQTCAAENRRRRKRGKVADPPKRVVINPAVCEGCGDCGIKSNCVAIKPLDTPLGTKRQIDQTACNKDYSCVEGFCPAFVTVEGANGDPLSVKRGPMAPLPDDPIPAVRVDPDREFAAVIAGIGGTGVVTVTAVLAMAARLQGLHALALDQTGLSQKNGAVQSHLQISRRQPDDRPARLSVGSGTLLIACDMLASAGDAVLSLLAPGTASAVANGRVEPLPIFARDPSARPDATLLARRLQHSLGADQVLTADTSRLAEALLGDGIGSNLMLVGIAYQAGLLPIDDTSIEHAITLNGAATAMNIAAFRWGRWWVADRARVERQLGERKVAPAPEESYDELVSRLQQQLVEYQSEAYAQRFRRALAPVEQAEERLSAGARELSRAAALALHKTMAIKDEYEVARLHTHPDWLAQLERDFVADAVVRHHLAPPLLARRDPVSGEPRKRAFGGWIAPVYHLLRRMKALRGTCLDPFGWTSERRLERRLVDEVEELCGLVAAALSKDCREECREILHLPLEIKGFGHVKVRNLQRIRPRWTELVERLQACSAPGDSAEPAGARNRLRAS